MAREHCDSYLYYIRYKTLEITSSQTPFQVVFNPVKGISTGTYSRTIHPQNITLSIQDVFLTYMQKLIEFNENQNTPLHHPSHLEDYQLLWEQQDQQAYINFSQILTQTELLPYIIRNEHKHLQYRDLTSFNTSNFEQINLDHTFLVEHSETSDNRPLIKSDISPETTPEKQISNVELPYTRQHSVQSEQEDLATLFQNPEPHQVHPLYPPLPQVSDIQQANPSETATVQNTSEFSEETIQNTQR